MNDQKTDRELGLIDILQIIGGWIASGVRKIVSWVLYLFFFGLKRWKFLVSGLLLVAILTVVKYSFQESHYEASMLIRSNVMSTAQMKSFLDNYSNVLNNGILSEKEKTQKTNISVVAREEILSLSTYYCVDKNDDGIMDEVDYSGKITPANPDLDSINLCIKVLFRDIEILSEIEQSLLYYINNVDYIVQMNKARLMQLQKRKDFIRNEIRLLDEMQQRSYGDSETMNDLVSKGNVVVDNRKLLSLYEDKVELWDLYENIEKEIIYFSEPITVIEDFVVQKTAVNTLSSMLKKNLMYALLVIYVLLLLYVKIGKEKDKYMSQL